MKVCRRLQESRIRRGRIRGDDSDTGEGPRRIAGCGIEDVVAAEIGGEGRLIIATGGKAPAIESGQAQIGVFFPRMLDANHPGITGCFPAER